MTKVGRVEADDQLRNYLKAVVRNVQTSQWVRAGPAMRDFLAEVIAQQPEFLPGGIRLLDGSGIICAAHLPEEMPGLPAFMLIIRREAVRALRPEAAILTIKYSSRRQISQGAIGHPGSEGLTTGKDASKATRACARASKTRHPNRKDRLSSRELEIVALLAKGCSNREISSRLFIATGTVRTHLIHLFKKLQVNTRTKAAAKFLGSQPFGNSARPTSSNTKVR